MERIITRISYGTINARDCLALKSSLFALPGIKDLLSSTKSALLTEALEGLDDLEDIRELLERCINEDAPVSITDGGIIKKGYNVEADKLADAAINGKNWLVELEAREKEATGIKNLKIRYNKVFGYYIEVTKSNLRIVICVNKRL